MTIKTTHDAKTVSYILMLGVHAQGFVEDEYISEVKCSVKQSDGTWWVQVKLKDDVKTLIVDDSTYKYILKEVVRGDTLSIGRESKHIMKNHKPLSPMMSIEQYMTSLMILFCATVGVLSLMLYLLLGSG